MNLEEHHLHFQYLMYGMFGALSPADFSEVLWTIPKPPGDCSSKNMLCLSFSYSLKKNPQKHSKLCIWAHHKYSRNSGCVCINIMCLHPLSKTESWMRPGLSLSCHAKFFPVYEAHGIFCHSHSSPEIRFEVHSLLLSLSMILYAVLIQIHINPIRHSELCVN